MGQPAKGKADVPAAPVEIEEITVTAQKCEENIGGFFNAPEDLKFAAEIRRFVEECGACAMY